MTGLSNSILVSVFLPASLLSAGLVYVAAKVARQYGMVDIPGERQSHTVATATGGGIGIMGALLVSSLVWALSGNVAQPWLLVVLPGLAMLSLVGWMDDRKSLSTLLRLFVQLVVSFSLLAFLAFKGQLENELLILSGGMAIVWIMNFFNFMDGSHGMAGFQGIFTGLLLTVLFQLQNEPELVIPALLLAACCAGFLPFNFPRPQIFMGDSGSVPLGFAVAALLALGLVRDALSFPVALLVLAVFLVDSSLTLLNRVIGGERWYTAHKQHMYQRLIGQGWPHSRVLLLYQAVNIILVVPVTILVTMYPEYAWPLTGMSFLLLTAGWYTASLRLGVRK